MQCMCFRSNLQQCVQILKRYSRNWFNVALIFLFLFIFFFFGLFNIDGDQMVPDGLCHNNIFHFHAGGTKIVGINFLKLFLTF